MLNLSVIIKMQLFPLSGAGFWVVLIHHFSHSGFSFFLEHNLFFGATLLHCWKEFTKYYIVDD